MIKKPLPGELWCWISDESRIFLMIVSSYSNSDYMYNCIVLWEGLVVRNVYIHTDSKRYSYCA